MRLSAENSAEPGYIKFNRTPYMIEIANAFKDPKVKRIAIGASAQVAKTTLMMAMLGYIIDIDPGPVLWIMPTDSFAEDFSKRRLDPFIRDTQPLKKKVSDNKSRSSSNTIKKKKYPGGMLTLAGANSPSNLAGIPARYVFGDEVDRWTKNAGGEGDPTQLLEARTATFHNSKMVQVSTPTIKGTSTIEKSFFVGTQEYWEMECPECKEYSFITFDNIRFSHEEKIIRGEKTYTVKDIHYACPHCGCALTEQQTKQAPHKWVPKNPDAYQNGARSFWINGFSSPWMTWEKIILRFLEASGKNDVEKLKTVFNTMFGQLWEDRGDLKTEEEMMEGLEEYEAELPEGVLYLTCGVDTQDNRLEYEVVGYGMFEETWGIQKGVIWGRPDDPDVWAKLDNVINHDYQYYDGRSLKISVTFVDSGGHYTQEVYRETAKRFNRRVFAIKGRGGEGIPYTDKKPSKVEVLQNGDVAGWCYLYTIGVDAGKEHIMSALQVQQPGAKFCHFPSNEGRGYDDRFFHGLLSEKLVNKNGKWVWEKLSEHIRNEPLDCRNYANAAYKIGSPDMKKLQAYMLGNTEKEDKPVRIIKKQVRKQRRSYADGDW